MNKQELLLTILMEECCEIAQDVSKALRFGLNDSYKNSTNLENIQTEYNDLLGVIEMVNTEFGINIHRDQAAIDAKQTKVLKYIKYSIERGRVNEDQNLQRYSQ